MDILGPLIGCLVGGFITYKINIIILDRKLEIKRSKDTKDILKELDYTHKVITTPMIDGVEFKGLLYDLNWFDKLSNSLLEDSEKEKIFNWFSTIHCLSNGYGYVERILDEAVQIPADQKIDSSFIKHQNLKQIFHKGKCNEILNIIKKNNKF